MPRPPAALLVAAAAILLSGSAAAHASEADLVMPDLGGNLFLDGRVAGDTLLKIGLGVCVLGLLFGAFGYVRLKALPVHKSMAEVSDLIYATCKTYLLRQGQFILLLWAFIAVVIGIYFGKLAERTLPDGTVTHGLPATSVAAILAFSLLGMAGSYAVAWFGMRVNTFANSRTALASLRGMAYPVSAIPLRAGMSIGMALISLELLIMLCILLFVRADLAGPCFIGFAVGESLAAATLRVAGGIFTKVADIGADLMKIVFNVKEDDARNPGVIADCVGDNAGDSVGPTADGFETYGVTGVALVTFILLAISPEFFLTQNAAGGAAAEAARSTQVSLLVWIFATQVAVVVTSALAYGANTLWAKARYAKSRAFDFELPLTSLVWVASLMSVAATFAVSWLLIRPLGDGTLWWKLASIVALGTLAGAIIPEAIKVFTSTHSRHVREVVQASREGGASLNVLSGLTAGNFSAFWVGGVIIMGLMAAAYAITLTGAGAGNLGSIMPAPAVFAFGLLAFGFLGVGPVTIAVDSYGPVTDNAQSVYELSLIEQQPGIEGELKRDFGIDSDFEHAKHLLEQNDGAGNTFKATAKPVLIGTAVVGATTMIFSIVVSLTDNLKDELVKYLSVLHPPFLLGLIGGAAVVYWFTGASTQAVITGAYRAVEYIKQHMRLDERAGAKASEADSRQVVDICTKYAQAGMFNCFLVIFFITLAAAFAGEFFFVGYLVGLSISGLFQAVFMANAGGAWDNAKKIVEVELKTKSGELHKAVVVGDTVGDPFKDTSSVALNPIIKFATLFGLLAVELAITLKTASGQPSTLRSGLAAAFLLVALFFVYRSFYGMRIRGSMAPEDDVLTTPRSGEPVPDRLAGTAAQV